MIPSMVSLIFIACSVFVGFFPPILCVSVFLWFVLGLFWFFYFYLAQLAKDDLCSSDKPYSIDIV